MAVVPLPPQWVLHTLGALAVEAFPQMERQDELGGAADTELLAVVEVEG